MKIGVIGDLHGLGAWSLLCDRAEQLGLGQIVFMGDYIDDFTGSDKEHIANLRRIMDLEIPDVEIIRLIGNHDAQYISDHFPTCSGYRLSYSAVVRAIFEENEHKLKFAHQVGNILFTHAGVSKRWCDQPLNIDLDSVEPSCLADIINNKAFSREGIRDLGDVGLIRGGDQPVGGPLWADRRETKSKDDQIPGIHQVAGHSMIKEVARFFYPEIDASITYVDCLRYRKQFLVIDGAEMSVLDLSEVPQLTPVTEVS